MKGRIIADTGIILGLIYEKDQWNKWASSAAKDLEVPYLTCESVINESCHLLKSVREGEAKVLEFIEKGVLEISFSLQIEAPAITNLMRKYRDLPMSLADACLVRMSEIHDNAAVFTVDTDFLVYRKQGRKKIPLISPF